MKLKDYWPRCLQDLVEFQQIANAEQPEFETALDDVRTAADDFFLATLSEYGCQRWEAIMGLHAADGDTLEARRERILIKYLDQLPYTYRTLLKYLKTITDDFTVTLDENAYDLFIRIRLEGYSQRDALIATLGQILTRAATGSGVATVSPNTLSDLVTPENVAVSLGEKDLIEGDPAIMRIPVQVTNEALDAPVWIREVAVYGNTIDNTEVMFCYGWLDGDDSDNVLPATSFEEDADTVHIHDLAVFVTNQEAASVSVQVAPGSYVTREQMTTYAAPLVHTQGADTVTETTGENTEQVQRRQDSDIEAIKEQLNTGFTGTTVTHTFAPAQLSYWKGYDGTGVPEGILDQTRNRLYL